jgi:hypothetical protein
MNLSKECRCDVVERIGTRWVCVGCDTEFTRLDAPESAAHELATLAQELVRASSRLRSLAADVLSDPACGAATELAREVYHCAYPARHDHRARMLRLADSILRSDPPAGEQVRLEPGNRS